MEKTKKKKTPVNVMTKATLAAMMLGTTIGSQYVDAAEPTDDNDNKSSESSKASMPVKVDDSKINKAVDDAKKAGVKVKKDADKKHNVKVSDVDKTQKEIQADYDKQIKALEDATKKAKASDNSDEVKSYEEKVKKEKDAVDKAKSNPNQPKYSEGAGNKFSKSGSWTNLKSQTLDNDVHLASSGTINSLDDLTNGNFKIHAYSDKKGKIKNSNIVQKVNWGDTAPKGKGIVKGDKITEDAKKKVPGYNESLYNTSGKDNPRGETTQLHSVKAGTWVTIPKAVQLADGSKKDLKVKFTKSGTNLDYGEDWVTFWNEGGAINYYDGSHDINNTPPKDKIKATYQVDDGSNGKNKYLWTGAVLDIDGGQELTIDSKTRAILGMGGGLKANGDDITTIKSDDNLGKTWGKNKTEKNFLDGTRSVPDGTVVFADYAGEISHTLANTGVPTSTLVANGDFGLGVKTSIAEAPEKPKDVNANYHLNKLEAMPSNHKDVEKGIQKEDTEATINGEKVQVGDQITYPLTNTDLPADRQDDIKSYVMKDKLPDGVTPDKDAIEKNVDKSKWDVKIDGQDVTVTATKDLLADMNKDKTKAFKVPTVGLVATVTKGGDADLDNTFDTIINDNTVKSNKVTNTPPPIVKKQAKKTVSTDKVVDFNQKYQYGLDFTIPNDKNYKDVEIKDSDMTKGSLDFDKVVVKQGDKDITDQGELKLDKEKDTFTWKAKDPAKLLGKNIHVDIDAKVKPGTDLSKYKTNEKDKDGNVIYSMPNTGHLVLDGEDTPTNEVPIKVKERPGSIKKSIVEGDSLTESNKAKFGDDITYNLDAQFANNEKGNDVFVKDQLEKDVLDIQKDKIHVYMNNDEASNAKSDDAKATDDKTTDAKSDDTNATDDKATDAKSDDANATDDKTTDAKSDDAKAADDKSTDAKSDAKSDDTNATDDKSTDAKSDDAKATDDKSTDAKSDDAKATDDKSTDAKSDDAKAADDKVTEDKKVESKDFKTGKYTVGKDIDAGTYTIKNNDKSDANVATHDKDGKLGTNETIKSGETKDVTLKDGEELSVTAGTETVSFVPKTDEGTGEAKPDEKDDKETSDETKSDETKSDEKDNKETSDEAKSGETKSDEKDNKETSDEAKSDGTKTDSKSESVPNVKDMKDVTEQGTLKVDEEGESFIWTPKDPSKFKGKKVIVQVGAKFKEDKNGNYKKYEKDGKYVVPNVAELGSGDKDKVKKSNKVITELTPKKEDKTVPPKKDTPDKPSTPKKDTPDKPSTPKKDTPSNPSSPKADSPQRNGQGNPEKPTVAQQADLPSTGSNTADGGIIGAIVAAIAGVTGWVVNRKRKNNNEQS